MNEPAFYSQYVYAGTTYTVALKIPHVGEPTGQKRYTCYACHQDFQRGEVMFYKGRPYGIPCGCSRDIDQMRRS